MKLQHLATIFSIVPLLVVLSTSLPGAYITADATRAVFRAERSEELSELAGDVEDAGFKVAAATRNAAWSTPVGVVRDLIGYEQARRDLLSTTARLESAAASSGSMRAPLGELVTSVHAFLAVVADANRATRRGDRVGEIAVMNGSGYARAAQRLRNSAHTFSQIARHDELFELAALRRQSEASKALIAFAVGSFALLSVLMFTYLGRTAHRIRALTRKTARYHQGEPIGPPSRRRDEIGVVANTLHEVFTERRQMDDRLSLALDQALEASQLKSEFVATISHEIRTPMHGVIAMTDLLLQTRLDARQREVANTISESAQALLAIVNDVLDFSKLEARRIALEEVDFDPAQVLNSVVALARATALHKPIRLQVSVACHVAPALHGDATRLRQVLINVIGNAVKFTATGTVTAAMSIVAEDEEFVTLGFTISDTGVGVPAEMRESLFEPFVQADATSTRQHGGSGLGLSISRRLVELMDGTIWFGEHDGPGATFCFTVRLRRAIAAVVPPPPALDAFRVPVVDAREATRPTRSITAERSSSRILLAEDSALIRRVASIQLEELGIPFDIVKDGREAVTALQTCAYDIVLMDLRMPTMDGLEATRTIRAAEGESGRHAVIIALTANALDADREACARAGMDDFLSKPLQFEALRRAVTCWLPEGGDHE